MTGAGDNVRNLKPATVKNMWHVSVMWLDAGGMEHKFQSWAFDAEEALGVAAGALDMLDALRAILAREDADFDAPED